MVKITDRKVNIWVKDFQKKLYSKYSPQKVILFGSRARKDNLIDSDIDLIVVSKDFSGVKWPHRIGEVAKLWKGLIDIEPLCYTPEEFAIKKKQIGIVQQAVKEGIDLI
ncbi:nucleotidyltransferase domain-containing protein [Candidatus Woesearchaeota archaeon]|nr:nucleotidyltransferase domain-containing protein [Candidatus Woesearchaeota archaeon]